MKFNLRTTRAKPIRIAVIGLGKIGSQFDLGRKNNRQCRTHIGTILSNPDLKLVGVCDSSAQSIRRFYMDWKLASVPAFSSIAKLMKETAPQVVVVASPTKTHYRAIKQILTHKPRLIFCEKPFCASEIEASKIHALAKQRDVSIAVNYHRRWDPRFEKLKVQLKKMKNVASVTVTYRKGLFNYGSHAVDLLHNLFGPVKSVRPAVSGKRQPVDPSLSATLVFKSGITAHLIGVDGVDYELFEFEIYCRDRKFKLEFGGYEISEFLIQKDKWFKGYPGLCSSPKKTISKPVDGFRLAYEDIVKFKTRSSSQSAIEVHQVLKKVSS